MAIFERRLDEVWLARATTFGPESIGLNVWASTSEGVRLETALTVPRALVHGPKREELGATISQQLLIALSESAAAQHVTVPPYSDDVASRIGLLLLDIDREA